MVLEIKIYRDIDMEWLSYPALEHLELFSPSFHDISKMNCITDDDGSSFSDNSHHFHEINSPVDAMMLLQPTRSPFPLSSSEKRELPVKLSKLSHAQRRKRKRNDQDTTIIDTVGESKLSPNEKMWRSIHLKQAQCGHTSIYTCQERRAKIDKWLNKRARYMAGLSSKKPGEKLLCRHIYSSIRPRNRGQFAKMEDSERKKVLLDCKDQTLKVYGIKPTIDPLPKSLKKVEPVMVVPIDTILSTFTTLPSSSSSSPSPSPSPSPPPSLILDMATAVAIVIVESYKR